MVFTAAGEGGESTAEGHRGGKIRGGFLKGVHGWEGLAGGLWTFTQGRIMAPGQPSLGGRLPHQPGWHRRQMR